MVQLLSAFVKASSHRLDDQITIFKSPRNASYTKLMTAGAAHGAGIYLATELWRRMTKGTLEQQEGNNHIQRWFIQKDLRSEKPLWLLTDVELLNSCEWE